MHHFEPIRADHNASNLLGTRSFIDQAIARYASVSVKPASPPAPATSQIVSPRSSAELLSENSPKFRQLPCRTFISVGTCPYRERCVYLHDPRLMRKDAKTKTRVKNKEDIIQDSLFWPVLSFNEVSQRLDTSRQPQVNQRYGVPYPQDDQYRRHDQAVFSMWMHFVTFCSLGNDESDLTTPRTHGSVVSYNPRPKRNTPSPSARTPGSQLTGIFLQPTCADNPFTSAPRLEVLKSLSQGEEIGFSTHVKRPSFLKRDPPLSMTTPNSTLSDSPEPSHSAEGLYSFDNIQATVNLQNMPTRSALPSNLSSNSLVSLTSNLSNNSLPKLIQTMQANPLTLSTPFSTFSPQFVSHSGPPGPQGPSFKPPHPQHHLHSTHEALTRGHFPGQSPLIYNLNQPPQPLQGPQALSDPYLSHQVPYFQPHPQPSLQSHPLPPHLQPPVPHYHPQPRQPMGTMGPVHMGPIGPQMGPQLYPDLSQIRSEQYDHDRREHERYEHEKYAHEKYQFEKFQHNHYLREQKKQDMEHLQRQAQVDLYEANRVHVLQDGTRMFVREGDSRSYNPQALLPHLLSMTVSDERQDRQKRIVKEQLIREELMRSNSIRRCAVSGSSDLSGPAPSIFDQTHPIRGALSYNNPNLSPRKLPGAFPMLDLHTIESKPNPNPSPSQLTGLSHPTNSLSLSCFECTETEGLGSGLGRYSPPNMSLTTNLRDIPGYLSPVINMNESTDSFPIVTKSGLSPAGHLTAGPTPPGFSGLYLSPTTVSAAISPVAMPSKEQYRYTDSYLARELASSRNRILEYERQILLNQGMKTLNEELSNEFSFHSPSTEYALDPTDRTLAPFNYFLAPTDYALGPGTSEYTVAPTELEDLKLENKVQTLSFLRLENNLDSLSREENDNEVSYYSSIIGYDDDYIQY